MSTFEEGYSAFVKAASLNNALLDSNSYVGYLGNIEQCINTLVSDLNLATNPLLLDKPASILKGDIAEFFVADTFNINAAINSSDNKVFVDRSTGLGSIDISSNFEKNFSLKYYKDGGKSATEQATSFWERYCHFKNKHPNTSLEEYLEYNNIPADTVISDSIYKGQVRIVPSDQLKIARDYARRKALENLHNTSDPQRQAVGKKWQETYEMLDSKIQDNEGNESIELSNQDALKLAELAKDGKVTAEELAKLGVDPAKLITYEHIIKQAYSAALSAAVMTTVLQICPDILTFVYTAITENKLDVEDIQNLGTHIVCTEGEAYIRGGVTAALTIIIKSGKLGNNLSSLTPAQIGAAVVILLNTMKNTCKSIRGEMTPYEVADNLVKDTIIITASLVGGSISQSFIPIPVIGYLIGNLIGATVGTIIHSGINTVTMALCVDTGFTMFGLVKQDYVLPDEVYEAIGSNIFSAIEYNQIEYTPREYSPRTYNPYLYNAYRFSITPLRRGVISVGHIGYI